ncbi:MAG: hypothetical protein EBU33_08715, partial [Sphingobacteriia bacterium]|nr:hypothetical protein [Sphingobacteriia bacterium]
NEVAQAPSNLNMHSALILPKADFKFKTKIIFLIISLFIENAFAEKPPEAIIEQLGVMATVQAAIHMCISSSEYKKLSATAALRFHDVTLRATDIIEIIENRYKDDVAYMAFMSASIKIGDSSEFKRNFAKTYSKKCTEQLLIDTTETLSAVKERVNSLVRKK